MGLNAQPKTVAVTKKRSKKEYDPWQLNAHRAASIIDNSRLSAGKEAAVEFIIGQVMNGLWDADRQQLADMAGGIVIAVDDQEDAVARIMAAYHLLTAKPKDVAARNREFEKLRDDKRFVNQQTKSHNAWREYSEAEAFRKTEELEREQARVDGGSAEDRA